MNEATRMKSGRLLRRAGTALVLTLTYLWVAPNTTGYASSPPLMSGDVLVGLGAGIIGHFDSTGGSLGTLDTATGSLNETGMCFDGFGRLHTTDYDNQSTSLFSSTSTLLSSSWTNGFTLNPESCIVDGSQNVYVGESDGSKYISEFDSSGNLVATFSPATDTRGSDWIDLAADQCTMYYTSEGNHVKRFDVCTNTQLTDFAAFADTTDACYTVRITSSGVLVACANEVYALNAAGGIDRTYTASSIGATSFYGLDLAPDGASFWVSDPDRSMVYHIKIADGSLITKFSIPSVSGTDGAAVTVVGAPTVSGGTTPVPAGNQPPTASTGGPYSGAEAATIPIVGTATDLENDPIHVKWTAIPPAGADAAAGCTFASATALSTTVSCNDEGVYTLKLTVTDTYAQTTAATTLTVNDVAPTVTITSPAPNALFATGTNNLAPVTVNAAFTDAGTADTHSCWIQWDTSTPAVAGTVTAEPSGATPGNCSATTNLGPGVYCITAFVTENENTTTTTSAINSTLVGQATVNVIVYDPYAGFVTGGGTIISPAGALTANATVVGQASFGFVSKYQKGAQIPTGETEFQFQVGNLSFHSTAYQWLVISGNMAQYKGTGTINGSGSYDFKLTARDGNLNGGTAPDGMRMKITNSTGAVVYDNVAGSCDTCSLGNVENLNSGNVIVHSS